VDPQDAYAGREQTLVKHQVLRTYSALRTTLKAEINADAWSTLHSAVLREFEKPSSWRIAVKVINHLGDEVMKVFRVE
jgi:adenine-specific DNA-methyltransferase